MSVAGLASSGAVSATQQSPGAVQYQITCGTAAAETATAVAQVLFVTPDVQLHANGTDRLLGEQFYLSWQSYADSCTPSGGAPNDGWTTTAFPDPAVPSRFDPQVASVGTYNYTLTCFSGPVSVTRSRRGDLRAECALRQCHRGPHFRDLHRHQRGLLQRLLELEPVELLARVRSCGRQSSTPAAARRTGRRSPRRPGTYTVDVFCQGNGTGMSAASAPLVLTVLAPPAPSATLSVTPTSVSTGEHFTVSWASDYAERLRGRRRAGRCPLAGVADAGRLARLRLLDGG